MSPSEVFLLPSPGRLEDSGKVLPRPPESPWWQRQYSPPLEGIEQISGRRPEFGMAIIFASSVPAITFPWGIREKKIPQGTWKSIST